MTPFQVKKIIVEKVAIRQGCKASDLFYDLRWTNGIGTDFDLTDLIKELVQVGQLVEVKYVLGNETRSFLLPKDTSISLG